MKISIAGGEYDLFESIQDATLGDLRVLKKERGITVRGIRAAFERVEQVMRNPDGEGVLDLLDDDDYTTNMIGVVYLAKRHAGEPITLEDAERVPAQSVFLVFKPDDVEDDADPKE